MHAYAALITVPSELACLRLITAPLFQTGSRVLPGPIRCIEATVDVLKRQRGPITRIRQD
jgi:hypothetical protein